MLTKKGKVLILESKLSAEQYNELKIAVLDLSVDMAAETWTKRGRQGLHTLLTFIRPAFEDELNDLIKL